MSLLKRLDYRLMVEIPRQLVMATEEIIAKPGALKPLAGSIGEWMTVSIAELFVCDIREGAEFAATFHLGLDPNVKPELEIVEPSAQSVLTVGSAATSFTVDYGRHGILTVWSNDEPGYAKVHTVILK